MIECKNCKSQIKKGEVMGCPNCKTTVCLECAEKTQRICPNCYSNLEFIG